MLLINNIMRKKMRQRIVDLLQQENTLDTVVVKGWVRTKRDIKDLVFFEINDGSCLSNIQVVVEKNVMEFERLRSLSTGSSLAVRGKLIESPAKGQQFEISAEEITVYGEADPVRYPLQKKRHSFEFLREIAHLRPRTNTFGAVFRVRNKLAMAIHGFFQSRGFLNVHTPVITANDCEGAGETFQVTTLKEFSGKVDDHTNDFFGKRASLTVSGQLEGELFATALDRIYTFGPTFRAENSNTSRHLSEFWMVEPEMAFTDLTENMDLAEAFLKSVLKTLLDECEEDMKFFDSRISKGLIDRLSNIIDSSFERITYTQAVEILEKSGEQFEYKVSWGKDLQSEHERYLTSKFNGPVIVTDYPKKIKPFYMYCNDDDKTVRAMDVLVPGVGEIIGGSEREYRLDLLLDRMKELGLSEDEYWWYIETRKYGTVPHSGFGLGFERLVQFCTGMENIRDVIPFPRTPHNLEF